MENIKENKRIKFFYQDKKYPHDAINSINHTNINNNINITNYYPSPSQNYCSKQTFTFIDENGSVQNAISYPIKTATHKTKKIKDSSPTPNNCEKKYHHCQSPYMKKILPSTKRQKSEEGSRIINKYKKSPSSKFFKLNKKTDIKNESYNDSISARKNETQNKIINKPNTKDNYYLDLSGDDLNNKFQSNRNFLNYYKTNTNNNSAEYNKINNSKFNTQNRPLLNNKSVISFESNGNESMYNILEKPYQISFPNKEPLYKITSYNKNEFITYNLNSPKIIKSHKNLNISYKKDISIEKKIINYIILIQSIARGFLLRIKLAQYLNLYERIKKGLSFIQFIILKRRRYALYYLNKHNINKKLIKYYNNSIYITPDNHISLEFKNANNKIYANDSINIKNIKNNNKIYQDVLKDKNKYQKNQEVAEIQKELNKKKIDYAVAEKRIKELFLENKKIQNINNIIVRDNKQLALKLKNSQNHRYGKLKIQNTNFNVINLTKKPVNKIKINNILIKLLAKKKLMIKTILYKYFYKYNFKAKLAYIKEINDNNNKQSFIIENNNFIINKNIIEKNENNEKEMLTENKEINIDKRNQKLNCIIKKKAINLYVYRNIFEKWMMRALIFKNKEFVKEKKKKKKEKFKQRKQKKLYGKSDKKTEEEIDNENSGDSDDFDIEQKYNYNNNKSGSYKKNNYFDKAYKK